MKIKIRREDNLVEYEVESVLTLLEALEQIKSSSDATLSFSHGCRSSVCGSCAVRVNEKEVLACAHKLQEGDIVEPLRNLPVVRDLVVDIEHSLQTNKRSHAYLDQYRDAPLTHEDEKLNALQSDCILCNSCYSACPVFSVNGEYLGPFALTRVWKYVSDKREANPKQKIDTIQQNGIWDCTLCNECTLVCPQGISPKQDIEKLRAKSAQFGYMDPSFGSFGGGFDSFGGGFDGSPQF
ncbi:Succinate dehydrogenase iron-sulfur protein [hydrothermal vent metagenome]|uniref:succinate dehydrogenase n=1 Tax=hydrothermal vent metagenome TaxID=652676 RepID=A0A1W1C1I7_9ZZZZ